LALQRVLANSLSSLETMIQSKETNMEFEKLSFTQLSIADPNIKSLVLEVNRQNGAQIMDLLYKEGNWQLTLVTDEGPVMILWQDFIGLINRFLLFMDANNNNMLQKCEENEADRD
jgi:hypothetical protein